MRDLRAPLIVLAVVVVLAAVVWMVSRPEHEPSRLVPVEDQPVRFDFADLAITSPDLAVAAPVVRGSIRSDYASWVVVLRCAEPEGCAGEFSVEVSYLTGGERRSLTMVSRCDAPDGGELRFEGLQDPPTPIDGIEGLELTVIERSTPGQEPDESIEF